MVLEMELFRCILFNISSKLYTSFPADNLCLINFMLPSGLTIVFFPPLILLLLLRNIRLDGVRGGGWRDWVHIKAMAVFCRNN